MWYILVCSSCGDIPAGWKMCIGVAEDGVLGGVCGNFMCGPLVHKPPCSVVVEVKDQVSYLCPDCNEIYKDLNAAPASPSKKSRKA